MASENGAKPTTISASEPLSKPIRATDVPSRSSSAYPAEFHHIVQGRSKRALGDAFGLTNFGINMTRLEPGASSALLHHHKLQDEFVYILRGTATLKLENDQSIEMKAGDCVGFPAGKGVGHCITNCSSGVVEYFEIGDRTPTDVVEYPDVDLKAVHVDGKWNFVRKNGESYEK